MDPLTYAVVLGVVLLALAFLVTYKNANAALAVLTGVTAGLFAVQVADVHLFSIVVTLWWMTAPRAASSRLSPYVILGSTLLVAGTAVTGDMVNNPLLGVQLMILALNGAMIVSRGTATSEAKMLRGLLVTCASASLAAVLQVAGVLPAELVHQEVSGLGRPSGIYPEPDWMGLFATIGFVLALRTTTGRARLLLVLVTGGASVLAFARAPWVALCVVLVAYALVRLVTPRRGERRRGAASAVVFVCVAGAVLLAVSPDLRSDLTTRASTLLGGQTDDVSGQARIDQTEALRSLLATAPWHGHGVSASGRVGVSGVYDPASENSVGSNWILALLVDAKLLALPLIGLFLVAGARRATTVPCQLLILLMVNNLFSNATIQPVTWMMLALALTTATKSTGLRHSEAGDRRHGLPVHG